MGIHTEGPYRAIYVDTPGLHIEEKRAINRLMNRAASSSIGDVELVIFVVEGTHWTPDDEMVLNKLRDLKCPVIPAINKVDNVVDKTALLPHIQFLSQQMNFWTWCRSRQRRAPTWTLLPASCASACRRRSTIS